jgi:lipid-A-disaccharide synthase-like uncharacterized protein
MSSEDLWAFLGQLKIHTWTELVWAGVGMGGQALFFMRFFIQWLASERKKESVIPIAFWYFSLGGGLVLFVYACYQRDPVFMLGQGGGLFFYVRNLVLISRHRARTQAAAAAVSAPPDGAAK